jgi:hypothetical protein
MIFSGISDKQPENHQIWKRTAGAETTMEKKNIHTIRNGA